MLRNRGTMDFGVVLQTNPPAARVVQLSKLAEAHGLRGMRVDKREDLEEIVAAARAAGESVVIDFRVEKEDAVYPMVPSGADLHNMIRRPGALAELSEE